MAAALGPMSIGATAVIRAEDSLAAYRGLESAADVTARREGPHLETREARRKGLTRVEVLLLASGVGPVAFSQSHVELAHVIAVDGTRLPKHGHWRHLDAGHGRSACQALLLELDADQLQAVPKAVRLAHEGQHLAELERHRLFAVREGACYQPDLRGRVRE